MDTVRQFYMDGWGNLKNSNVAVTFHEAFEGVDAWNSWGSGMWDLLLDTHHYQVFDNGMVSQSPDAHIKQACDFAGQMTSTGKNTISGEWTGGMTDCAKWLNGKNKGARYDGTLNGASKTGDCTGKSTGSVAALSSDDKYNIGRFIEAQLTAYEKAAGWIFWTWKTEGAPEWDMQDLLKNGLFPSPVGDMSKRKCEFLPASTRPSTHEVPMLTASRPRNLRLSNPAKHSPLGAQLTIALPSPCIFSLNGPNQHSLLLDELLGFTRTLFMI
jgi:glucan 1,3-beta-glucosidase